MTRRFDDPVFVTRPFLPPLEEFTRGCAEVWANRWLTNDGPMLERFHAALAGRFGVGTRHLALFSNGTLALELGYYAMGLAGGDVVTTPFTFVATSHALKRIGATPVFADVDPETLCLSPAAAARLVTSRTRAVVPVHVYGNLCDVEGFARLGRESGVKVVYDAAHAFGVDAAVKGGDMAMFSFHATKLFHSCEGGCLVFRDPEVQESLFRLRNFAIKSETECVDVGSNAKMNELQALMGLCCLRHADELLASRRRVSDVYERAFAGTEVKFVGRSANAAYCPVLFRDNETRERVYEGLKDRFNVYARRYFYPLLTDFAPYVYAKGSCPVAEDAAARVLTLPTYHDLKSEDAASIAEDVLELASSRRRGRLV